MSFGKVVGRSRVKGINMATPGPSLLADVPNGLHVPCLPALLDGRRWT